MNLFQRIEVKGDSVTIHPPLFKKIKGHTLVSYLKEPCISHTTDSHLSGHSNRWESREIARSFAAMGYITDVIDWDNKAFIPKESYDVIFDIYSRFYEWKGLLNSNTKKLLHLTGSYPLYQNNAEKREAKKFEQRTGVRYLLKRQVSDVKAACESIKLANRCSLLGNKHTLLTYPSNLRSKIYTLPVSSSYLKFHKPSKYVPNRYEFLWCFGSGAVHKGLDKTIEVFLQEKDIYLHIVGNVEDDAPFWKAYREKIEKSPNITYHGFLHPDSNELIKVVKRCFCFIAPSCSESMSTSVATCLEVGLYPIISKDTGISLPAGCGLYLDNLSINEIKAKIDELKSYSDVRITEEIKTIQTYALEEYSRKKFSKNIRNYLHEALS